MATKYSTRECLLLLGAGSSSISTSHIHPAP